MKEQSTQPSIEELKNQITLKEREYYQAMKAGKKFEDMAKLFSEKRILEQKLNTITTS